MKNVVPIDLINQGLMDKQQALQILELEGEEALGQLLVKYKQLKDHYSSIQSQSGDLKTQLACQNKLIEIDDAYLVLISKG
ncbi:MAG: hypothetical protein ACYCOO_11240 [Chitinophagaceae bacterium]